MLHVPDTDQQLIVYSASPDSPEAEALALVRPIGLQEMPVHNSPTAQGATIKHRTRDTQRRLDKHRRHYRLLCSGWAS